MICKLTPRTLAIVCAGIFTISGGLQTGFAEETQMKSVTETATSETASASVDSEDAQIAYLEGSCERGNRDNCTALGMMHINGEGVAANIDKGLSIIQQACEHKGMFACMMLGNLYAEGDIVEQDQQKAAKYHQIACEGGLINLCQE